MKIWRRVTLVAIGCTVILSGCGGPESTAEEIVATENTLLAQWVTSLSGESGLSFEQKSAAFTARLAAVEELTAACMLQFGFDYTPEMDRTSITEDSGRGGILITPDEARLRGYGITDDIVKMRQTWAQYATHPNRVAYERMSTNEQRAYDVALEGEPLELGPDEELPTTWDRGCRGQAETKVPRPDSALLSAMEAPQWSELMERWGGLVDQMNQRPQLIDLNQKWANCMADGGYPGIKDPTEGRNILANTLPVWDNQDPLPPAVASEARTMEIAAAVVDAECQAQTDYGTIWTRLLVEVEEEFLRVNKAELEAFSQAVMEAQDGVE